MLNIDVMLQHLQDWPTGYSACCFDVPPKMMHHLVYPSVFLKHTFLISFCSQTCFFFTSFLTCLWIPSSAGPYGLPLVHSQNHVFFPIPVAYLVYPVCFTLPPWRLQKFSCKISVFLPYCTSSPPRKQYFSSLQKKDYLNFVTALCSGCVNNFFMFLMLNRWRWFAVLWWDGMLAGTVWVQCWTHLLMKKRNKWGCSASLCWLLQKTSSLTWVSNSWYIIGELDLGTYSFETVYLITLVSHRNKNPT